MFVTSEPFRNSFQLTPGCGTWRAIESRLHWSMYIVTVKGRQGHSQRTYLLSGACELLDFVPRSDIGVVTALSILISPTLSKDGTWEIAPIIYIDRIHTPEDPLPYVLLTAKDGRRFGGHPTQLLQVVPRGESTRIAVFFPPTKRSA